MSAVLKVVDEHFGIGAPVRRPAGELRLVSHRTTPREIIQQRVQVECDEIDKASAMKADSGALARSFLIDVTPGSLKGKLRRAVRAFAVDGETERAFAAFTQRNFIMLVDDHQTENLDEPIILTADSEVVFLYLTPLKGG